MKETQLSLFMPKKGSTEDKGRYKVILPFDMFFLCSAAVILLLLFSFSLGVERGKKIAIAGLTATKQAPIKSKDLVADESIEKAENEEKAPLDAKGAQEKETEKEKKYHIQVASFQKEKSARQEAKQLEKNGYPVSILTKGEYVVVYVGGFDDEKEANSYFKILKQRYGDCILRRRL